MNKLRVAFFTEVLTRDFDGAARTIFHIIDRIDRDRFEFLFFTGVRPADDFIDDYYYVSPLSIPMNKDYGIAWPYGKRSKISRRLEQFAPDLIHISTPSFLGHFALGYATKNNIPTTSIYHTHFISYVQYYTKGLPVLTPLLETAATRLTRRFYDRCTRVFLPTEAMRQDLVQAGLRKDNMRIWPRGIRLDQFDPSRRDDNYIRSLVDDPRKKNILFVSRIVWEKNLATLINVYRLITAKELPFNLIIAGDGVALEDLQAKMPRATFLGNQTHDQLSKLYASSDYFLFTSISETFGNVITEAMASGLPCIIADGGGSRSLVNHGVTGYLCEPNDAESYIEKILLLEEQPQQRETIINSALEQVKKLSWKRLVASLLEQMEEVSQTKV